MYFEKYDPYKGKMLEILDQDGNIINKKLVPKITDEKLVSILKTMIKTRVTDEKLLKLQRQGRIFTFPPNLGQEGATVGSIAAIEKTDWLVTAYRELGAWMYHGFPLSNVMTYWTGNENGLKIPENVKMTPFAVPLASQLQHAVGIAFASKYKGLDEVTISYVGDGATSEGDFHEAMNFAAVNNTPNIFIIQNNQWAISTPLRLQSKAPNLAVKSIGYGMRGIKVDGNDPLAVYAATKEAVDLAREGKGPSIIECMTYRMGPHTTSDDPTKYRSNEEVEIWKAKDPISRFQKYLVDLGLWSDEERAKFDEEFEKEFKAEFAIVEKNEKLSLEEVIDYTYSKRTPDLERQYQEKMKYYRDTNQI
ncbi:MAG: pyruvate dehydrogenase (acetyl-transferring) E1 component subunit alpha [Clostridiales bacterium]|nr:MAG: pyruvate dehydrogenase (acetyl-transferring) E1 component subunit alpha [Clostridiales bacterium]